ncbi:DUF5006 domain-containing protein [Bacteroides ovatus]|nr:DUF5006 domain-containing protein [Bacteroides ovatus]
MKNILYKIFPICLLTMGLTGCEEETKYRPLPEIVPLTMNINDNAFAMGEHLKVNINVEPDADGKEVVANEDFDIYFTAKAGNGGCFECIRTVQWNRYFSEGGETDSGGFSDKGIRTDG